MNMFNNNKPNNCSCGTPEPSSYNTKPFTKANLRELLNELLVESNEAGNDAFIAEDVPGSNESTLLLNSTAANKLNPGNIKKDMSIPGKGKSAPSPTKNIANKSEITINGKIYR